MKRSGSQLALKVICIIQIVIASLGIIAGILFLVAGPVVGSMVNDPQFMSDFSVEYNSEVPSDIGVTPTEGLAVFSGFMMAVGFVALISSILDVIIGALGIHGANHPDKIGPFFVLCIIGFIISIGAVIFGIAAMVTGNDVSASGSSLTSSIVQFIMMAIILWLAGNVRRQAVPKQYG